MKPLVRRRGVHAVLAAVSRLCADRIPDGLPDAEPLADVQATLAPLLCGRPAAESAGPAGKLDAEVKALVSRSSSYCLLAAVAGLCDDPPLADVRAALAPLVRRLPDCGA